MRRTRATLSAPRRYVCSALDGSSAVQKDGISGPGPARGWGSLSRHVTDFSKRTFSLPARELLHTMTFDASSPREREARAADWPDRPVLDLYSIQRHSLARKGPGTDRAPDLISLSLTQTHSLTGSLPSSRSLLARCPASAATRRHHRPLSQGARRSGGWRSARPVSCQAGPAACGA